MSITSNRVISTVSNILGEEIKLIERSSFGNGKAVIRIVDVIL